MYRMLPALGVLLISFAASAQNAASPVLGEPARQLGIDQILQAPEGRSASWEDLRGNVVVVEYWATWCQPCLAYGLPHMNELAEQFKDRPVVFISVTDESAEVVERFVERIPIKGWIGIDPDRSALKAYDVAGIPKTLVVDGKGRLAALTYPTKVTAEAIEAVLDGNLPDLPLEIDTSNPVVAGEDPVADVNAPAGEMLFTVSVRKLPGKPGSFSNMQSGNAMTRNATTPRSVLSIATGIAGVRIDGPADMLDETWLAVVVKVPRHELMGTTVIAALQSSLDLNIERATRPAEVLVLSDPSGSGGKLRGAEEYMNAVQHLDGIATAVGTEMPLLVGLLEQLFIATVIDETGLKGAFDWTFEWDGDAPREAMMKAVKQQLGLSIRTETRPMEWLEVRPVER